jgi:hypothetical protein
VDPGVGCTKIMRGEGGQGVGRGVTGLIVRGGQVNSEG